MTVDEIEHGHTFKVVLDPETDAKLKKYAKEAGVNPGFVARIAIRTYLGLFPKR